MKKFDTKVQYLKYKVLREVARSAWQDKLLDNITEIPKVIVPGKEPTMRCCVYKERAIVSERMKLAMGGNVDNPNVVEVIDIACDECPVGGFEVTNACRGCIAHRCEEACKRGAISFDHNQKAHIDKSKCVECGQCAKVCPYSAIANNKRPCEKACKVKAINMNEEKVAAINNKKCVECGACVYQCPFGAIMDKSFILNVIDILKKSEGNKKYKTYAVIAPSISSQFSYARLEQVVSGLKELGFHTVIEAALGADLAALKDAEELEEKGFITSSCCPAFVSYIKKHFPNLEEFISDNLSPMALVGQMLKNTDPSCKVIFIGPCIAKKSEMGRPEVKELIDSVITFEELQALFDSKDIDITKLEDGVLDNASYYGRIFARSGGVSDAIGEAIEEFDLNVELKPVVCNGIEECRMALLKKGKNVLNGNFIEGMACTGGCIGGAGCLTHGEKNKAEVDIYGEKAREKTIKDALSLTSLL
ncbi:MAG: 4Fe-4S dicluster domain-containing protein [Eubacterium sp.]